MSFRQNIDWNEIAKFSSPEIDWWDKTGSLWTLHAINPLRLQYIQSHVSLAGKKVLDIGCGAGILAESLAISGAEVTGIDLNHTAIQAGWAHLEQTKLTHHNINIRYQEISAADLAEQQAHSYDIISCMELLEHVPDPQQIILNCAQLLKPGGHVFFSTINRNWKSYLSAIIAAEYILKILPKNTHDFAKFIQPYELSTWADNAEININNFAGIKYNLFTNSFCLSDKVTINYLAHGIK